MENFQNIADNVLIYFYGALNQSPEKLSNVFYEDSIIDVEGKRITGKNEKGVLNVIEFFSSKEMEKHKYQIIHSQAQPTILNCIIVMIQGIYIPDKDKPLEDRSFNASMVLKMLTNTNKFVVTNYWFNLEED